MKQLFKNIGNLVMVLVLMVSTTGVSIFRLHCACLQHEHVSFYIEPENCHVQDHEHHCSCESTSSHSVKHDTHCANCDTRESFFVKLETEFLHSGPVTTQDIPEFEIVQAYAEPILIPILSVENKIRHYCNSSPPLISSGKEIITLHHQFKFDQQFCFV